MDHAAAPEFGGHRKSRAWKRLIAFALLACVMAGTTGCASRTWAFGTSRWVTGNDTDAISPRGDRPSFILFLPCLVFDFFFFPVAIIHDTWPRSPGTEDRD